MSIFRPSESRVQRQRANAVLTKMYELAVAGDVAAAGLYLDRVLGPVVAPRTTEHEGWAERDIVVPTREPAGFNGSSGPAAPKRLLSAAEVAEVAGISMGLVYRLQKTGKLPVCRIGRRVLVRREDLEILVRARLASE